MQTPADRLFPRYRRQPAAVLFALTACFAALGSSAAVRALPPVVLSPQQQPLGIQARYDQNFGAMIVMSVEPGSLAAKSGLRVGDAIVAGVDPRGREINVRAGGPDAFARVARMDDVTLIVFRAGLDNDEPLRLRVVRKNRAAEPASRTGIETDTGTGTGTRTGSSSRSLFAPGRAAAAAPKMKTLVLQKHTFQDAGFGGMDSHTMLVPKGWKIEGGVHWTPAETVTSHFLARVSSTDGRAITFDRWRSFMFSQSPYYQQAVRQQGPQAMASFIPPPQRLGEAAVKVLVPATRTGATNIQLVEVMRDPQSEKVMAQMLGGATAGMNTRRTVEIALVKYELEGQAYEEVFTYMLQVFTMPAMGMSPPVYNWSVGGTRAFRAPAGQLEGEFKSLLAIAASLRETPRWSICHAQLMQQISRIRHKGHMDRMRSMRQMSQQIAKTNSDISDSQMASWRRQQAMKDEGHRKSVNGALEVHDYKSRDGYSIGLDHSYDRAFQDSLGNIILTNDVGFDPTTDPNLKTNDWKQLERLGR